MKVQVFGQKELVEHIQKGGDICSHLISIGNPAPMKSGEDAEIPGIFIDSFTNILRLEFFDFEKKSHLGKLKPRRIPRKRDARRIIRFYKRNKEQADGFTIHCWQGVSRSTATALGILFLIHQNEQIAMDNLMQIRPEAAPHYGLIKFFDKILDSDLTSINNQLLEQRNNELKEWFFNEIDNGDALLEELEKLDEETE